MTLPSTTNSVQIQAVVRRCLEIGCNLLSRIEDQKGVTEKDSDSALAAVRWLSKGVQMVESKEGTTEVAKLVLHLKVRPGLWLNRPLIRPQTPLLESLGMHILPDIDDVYSHENSEGIYSIGRQRQSGLGASPDHYR